MDERLLRAKTLAYGVWLLLSLPFAWLLFNYIRENIYYGEFVHQTGRIAAWLLLFTLALTPLRLMFPASEWPRLLLRFRRYLGVAVFGYAAAHLGAYLVKSETLARILEEASGAEMWTGWLAMAIFFPLALTSSDWAMRRLGRRWKGLHRWIHAAAILTFAHWILTAYDPTTGMAHAVVLVVLESYRLWKIHGARRTVFLSR